LKIFITTTAGIVFICLGFLGLLLPFMPGFLFMLGAAACFASLSPRLRRRLHRQPRISRFLTRLESSTHLSVLPRIKLAFWAGLEALTQKRT